ncbi:hypothetical protein [Kitasatospora cinereorecta]|uniref:DUF1080 domain-containing protein n=1 Tax=Kitasatospora cinereorecta TaxID=285560 RepID=A0ABW0VKS2_9ACTN
MTDHDPNDHRPLLGRRALLLGGSVAALAAAAAAWELWPAPDAGPAPFRPALGPDGLVTNEYAFRNQQAADARVSQDWVATSGSLFARDGAGWTGAPDGDSPGPASDRHTGSSVFRLVTRRRDFGDCQVLARVRLQAPGTTGRTPSQDWDGAHLWLRYRSPQQLYALSFRRRDGHVEIKRKTPGPDADTSDQGDYRTLAEGKHSFPYGEWHEVGASARTMADGRVHLTLTVDGATVLETVDDDPERLTAPGGVGLRGDNTDLEFRDFRIGSY